MEQNKDPRVRAQEAADEISAAFLEFMQVMDKHDAGRVLRVDVDCQAMMVFRALAFSGSCITIDVIRRPREVEFCGVPFALGVET